MSSISIKGIIVGLLFGMVGSVVLGFVMMMAMAASFNAASMEDFARLSVTGTMAIVTLAADGALSAATGYVAARVAGRGELVNATLCNLIGAAIGLYLCSTRSPEMLTFSVEELVVLPFCGFLGGYLRLRQVHGVHA